MEKFDELLKKLNDLKIIQKSADWAEDLPEEIWKEYFEGKFKVLAEGLDVDTHRWYETSVTVINLFDEPRLMGIRYLTNSFSEQQEISDCYVRITFFEMKEIQVISYIKI